MPVASFHYRALSNCHQVSTLVARSEDSDRADTSIREEEVRQSLQAEHAAGFAEAEARLCDEYESKSQLETAKIAAALSAFEQTRKQYFARVESEIVKLALAIAGKIIHREAQVDPMLIAAIVQMALGQLKDGTFATLRVRPDEAPKWRAYFEERPLQIEVVITEDPGLIRGDCLLETELGSVNFSLNAQLKEVEQGFFDVLALKPQV